MFDNTHNSETVTTADHFPSRINSQHLRDSVKQSLESYFKQLDGQNVNDLYELFLSEVEAPLLDEVMTYTRGNQTHAANLLGLNRGTLRKKLKKYGMN